MAQYGSRPEAAIDRVSDISKRLADGWADWEFRCKEWSRGGFPASTDSDRRPKGQISDPTGNLAINGDDVEQLRRAQYADLQEFLETAVRMEARHDEIMRPTIKERDPASRGLLKCQNLHGCPDDAWAIYAGRCASCHRYLKRTDRDRTGRFPHKEAEIVVGA